MVIYALRKTEKRDSNYKLSPYNIRCEKLNLQSLERRRANNEIFFIHKLILGLTRAPFLSNRIKFNENSFGLRNVRPLTIEGEIVNNLQYSDPLRIAANSFNNIFNKLNKDILLNQPRLRNMILLMDDSSILTTQNLEKLWYT